MMIIRFLLALFFVLYCVLPGYSDNRFIAVTELKNGTGITKGEADIIADRLRVELFNTGKVTVLERDNMSEILKEQGFQQSGMCNDEACMVEIGEMLGVNYIVNGGIGKLGNMILFNAKVVDVQTGKIAAVVSKNIEGGIEQIITMLPGIAAEIIGENKGETVSSVPAIKENSDGDSVEPDAQDSIDSNQPEEEVVTSSNGDAEEKSGSWAKKNKNKAGMSFGLSFYKGDVPLYVYDSTVLDYVKLDKSGKNYYDSISNLPEYSGVAFNEYHMGLDLTFIIKAGKFVNVMVGPKYDIYSYSNVYTYTDMLSSDSGYTRDFFWNIYRPAVTLGIDFVKRFFPGKLNVGYISSFNFNIVKYSMGYDYINQLTPSTSYTTTGFGYNYAFGPHIGFEIMAGTHVGFNIEYRYMIDIATYYFVDLFEEEYKTVFTSSGLRLGLNFYF